MKKPTGLFLVLWLCTITIRGQCPDNTLLWNRLTFLQTSSKNYADQIRELELVNSNYKRCATRNDSTYLYLQERLSKAYYENGDFQQSLNVASKAIQLIRENGNHPLLAQRWLVPCYYRLASAYGGLNKVSERMNAFDSCIEISRRHNQLSEYSLYAIRIKVDYLLASGEFLSAVEYAEHGEQQSMQFIAQVNSRNSREYKMNFSLAKIKALIALKKEEEAEVQIKRSMSECKSMQLERYLGSLYHYMGNIRIEIRHDFGGIDDYRQALAYNTKFAMATDCKAAEATIGYQYFTLLNDYQKALYYYFKSFSHVNTDPLYNRVDSLTSLNVYNNIANVYVKRALFDSARFFSPVHLITSGNRQTKNTY